MLDLAIVNGNVYFDGGIHRVDIGVQDGKTVQVSQGTLPEAQKTVDASQKFVMPGAIDPHVHFGIYNPWENDFVTESKAAAAGGITTAISYFREKTPYLSLLPRIIAEAEKGSLIDFGIHLGILTQQHVDELQEYASSFGVISYKFYTNYMGNVKKIFGAEDALNLDEGDMDHIFRKTAGTNITICVHCENMSISRRLERDLDRDKENSLVFYEKRSPDYAETQSLMSTLYLARLTGAKVYIVHTSSGSSTEFVQRTKGIWGEKYTMETCPHYLSATASETGLAGKVNPPLRSAQNAEFLWEGIRSGLLTTIGSDHCPCTREKKGTGSLDAVKPGFGEMELTLPLLFSEGYHKRGLPLETIARITSANVAKAFGLAPSKGSIAPGADADIVLVDLSLERKVTPSSLHGSSGYSIYEGRTLKGWPVMTIRRGEIIAENGIVSEEGGGRYLKRS